MEHVFLQQLRHTWVTLKGLNWMTAAGVPSALLLPQFVEVREELEVLTLALVFVGPAMSAQDLRYTCECMQGMLEIRDMLTSVLAPQAPIEA